MAEQSTLDRVKQIVIDHLGGDKSTVVETALLESDLGADSLDAVKLMMSFEEEFGIYIPDEDADTVKTVGDAVQMIDRLRAA